MESFVVGFSFLYSFLFFFFFFTMLSRIYYPLWFERSLPFFLSSDSFSLCCRCVDVFRENYKFSIFNGTFKIFQDVCGTLGVKSPINSLWQEQILVPHVLQSRHCWDSMSVEWNTMVTEPDLLFLTLKTRSQDAVLKYHMSSFQLLRVISKGLTQEQMIHTGWIWK